MAQQIRADDQIDNSMARLLEADGSVNLAGNLDLGGFDLTNAGTITGLPSAPSTDDEVASKGYVDGVAQGLDVKDSARAATTAALVNNGWTASGSSVGKTLTAPDNTVANNDFDGVTLSVGDRLLVKDEAAGDLSHNGVYEVTQAADGSSQPTILTRTEDFDEDDEVTAGAFTFIEEGSTHANAGFVVTSTDPITVDTSDIVFSQFSGAGQITAGAGLTKSGDTIDFVANDDSLTVNADSVLVNTSTSLNTYTTNGVGLASMASGSIYVGQGAGTEPTEQAVSGDVTMDGSANVAVQDAGEGTIESTGSGIRVGDDVAVMGQTAAGNMYFHRQLSGGARETQVGEYELDNTPDTGYDGNHALIVVVNGLVQEEGEDYTVEGATIDFGVGSNTSQPSDTHTPNPSSDISALWYKATTTGGGV